MAVLERAIQDLRLRRALRDRPRARFSETIEAWFASRDDRWLYSFERVCALLRLDADAVRRAITRHASRARVRLRTVV